MEQMLSTDVPSPAVEQATLYNFSKCLRQELVAFIRVRTLQATAELPNKGKLEHCGPGRVANLIQLAFDAREMTLKLQPAPTTVDELVTVQQVQENER